MVRFEEFLTELRHTTKQKEKLEILDKYNSDLLKTILLNTYDPFILFNIKLKEAPRSSETGTADLSECADELLNVLTFCSNSKSSKKNRVVVEEFLSKLNTGSAEIVVGVLNKNLRSGINIKTVDSMFPDLIKKFNVQLANRYDFDRAYPIDEWIVSYKLDGLRCVALRMAGVWQLFSRTGKEFVTVDYIKPQLEELYKSCGYTFFDGELYRHGLKFEEIQGPVMASVNKQTVDVEYHVFIAGSAEDFLNNSVSSNTMEVIYGRQDLEYVKFVENVLIKKDEIMTYLEEAFSDGYEGLMLRNPNQLYDYKRSDNLLKLKSKKDNTGEELSDCIVAVVEYNDSFPIIEDGAILYKRMINRLVVEQPDGVLCKVGSGFDIDFRYKDVDDIIGKIVEIQHQGFGNNGRMRFPRFKRIREDL